MHHNICENNGSLSHYSVWQIQMTHQDNFRSSENSLIVSRLASHSVWELTLGSYLVDLYGEFSGDFLMDGGIDCQLLSRFC